MKKYRGSETGPKGVYLCLSSAEFVQLTEKVRALPGDSKVKYIKVPSVLALFAGPLSGLLLILFLPFVGIIGIISFLGYKLWKGVFALGHRTAQLASFSPQPGKAYFTRRGRKPTPKTAKGEKELAELEEEIAGRRRKGEQ